MTVDYCMQTTKTYREIGHMCIRSKGARALSKCRHLFAVCAVVCAVPAASYASIGDGERLAQCAALANLIGIRTGRQELAHWAQDAKNIYLDAAIQVAEQGGQNNSAHFVQSIFEANFAQWNETTGLEYLLSDDYRRWTSFCGRLTRKYDLAMPVVP